MIRTEFERQAKHSADKIYVPNKIALLLNPADYEEGHLVQLLTARAETVIVSYVEKGCNLLGRLSVKVQADPGVRQGELKIVAHVGEEPSASSALGGQGRRPFGETATHVITEKMGKITPLRPSAKGRLLFEGTERTVEVFFSNRLLFGRDRSCDVVIKDERVSRKHALLALEPQAARLMDLGSTNGTWRNGLLVEEEIILNNRDRIQISDVREFHVVLTEREGLLSSAALTEGLTMYLLCEKEFLLGRGVPGMMKADVVIPDCPDGVVKVEKIFETVLIFDAAKSGHLRVNGRKVGEEELKTGDLIEVGRVKIRWVRAQ